jgi:hypothetical protein
MTNRPTSQDNDVRMVAFVNLKAMCERASGTGHRYGCEITNKAQTRVRVWYDDGTDTHWLDFPAIPSDWDDDRSGNPRVFLEVVGGSKDADLDAFWPVTNSPKLWRNPDDNTWATRQEIDADKPSGLRTWHVKVEFDVEAAADDRRDGSDVPATFSAENEVRDLIGHGDQVDGRWPQGAFKITLT